VDARQLDAMPRAERPLRVREEALSLLREQGHMLPQNALADVVNAVSDAVVGMGPIEFLLKDPEVTEVMLNNRTRRRLRRAELAVGRVGTQARITSLAVGFATAGLGSDGGLTRPGTRGP